MCLAGAGGDLQLIDYSKTSQGYGRTEEAGGGGGVCRDVESCGAVRGAEKQKQTKK